MKWFKGLLSPDEIKLHYRKLAMEFHPDKGGDTAVMQEINNEYHESLKALDTRIFNDHKYKYNYTVENAIVEKIKKVINLPGVVVEICGYWLWVTGDTIVHKEYLKENGLKFSFKKKAWYFHTMKYYSKKGNGWSMNTIRNVWGSDVVAKNDDDVKEEKTVETKRISTGK